VFDGLFRTDLDAGTAFNAVVDSCGNRFSLFDIVDFSGAVVRAIAMPDAFVIVHRDGHVIVLPSFDRHRVFPFKASR
jgi:hypothetical protein